MSNINKISLDEISTNLIKQKENLLNILEVLKVNVVESKFDNIETITELVYFSGFNIDLAVELINKTDDLEFSDYDFIINRIHANNDHIEYLYILIEKKDFTTGGWTEQIRVIFNNIQEICINIEKNKKVEELRNYKIEAENLILSLKDEQENLRKKVNQVDIISNDLKNKEVHKIFEDDSEKFKNLARLYEIAFYVALAFLFLYFFGWYIEVDTANVKFKFAEQFHGNHTPTFYVQKISLLILSTTLAAFLLKRSFMNRRLADDAYRTAKELDALPRYMEGMPEEMKEKIRFDLAYKYFGNGIHHESYTGGENLMHENIKANTDFIKAVKDLTPKVEVPKVDKAPKDAA
ncbi:hypothetical protein [Acinetobacter tandoii]|uniref:hypothetical protein n=1 Tax=Acinetobacter tandoii TaxID=202954 RepID=UPI001C069092|nr:hypothetical protein [Acinetobacter tandoii]